MAAGEGDVKAIVSVYRDESDTIFLGISYDLRTRIKFIYTSLELFGNNFALQP